MIRIVTTTVLVIFYYYHWYLEGGGGGGVGYSSKFYTGGFASTSNPLSFYNYYTIFGKNGTPFLYLLLTNGTL